MSELFTSKSFDRDVILSSYKNGDVVSSETLFYNYGEDYIIFDSFKTIVHWIKNSTVFKTIYGKDFLLELEDVDFTKTKVITYYGQRIKVSKLKDLAEYSRDIEVEKNNINNLIKENSEELSKYKDCKHKLLALNDDNSLGKNGKYLEDILKEDEFFKERDKDKYKEFTDIYNDKNLLESLINYYKNKSDLSLKKYIDFKEKKESIVKEIENNLNKKWDYHYEIENYHDYKRFGYLIDLIAFNSNMKDMCYYSMGKRDIEQYLFKKKIDFNKYCEVLEIDGDMKEMAKLMLSKIFNERELKL